MAKKVKKTAAKSETKKVPVKKESPKLFHGVMIHKGNDILPDPKLQILEQYLLDVTNALDKPADADPLSNVRTLTYRAKFAISEIKG